MIFYLTKYFEYKIGLQFNDTPLVVEQNNYASKIVYVYIVYDLDHWSKIYINFTILHRLLGATNKLRNNDKEKYVYSGYGIAFDGKISRSFNDDFDRCVIIFGVDNNSLSHTDNLKNDFLILDEGDTFRINKSLGAPEKKLLLLKTKFCLSVH